MIHKFVRMIWVGAWYAFGLWLIVWAFYFYYFGPVGIASR